MEERTDKMIFSEKIPAGKRTYFLDLKENQHSHKYLDIVESRKQGEHFERTRIRIFEEDFEKFFDGIGRVKDSI